MEQQDIELQIWEYIDGNCDDAGRTHVQYMIANDTQWKSLYEQLEKLHTTIAANAELEQPSMRFAKNVMEAIAHTAITRPARSYINPLVIRFIASFFIVSILALVGYALASADWSVGDGGTNSATAFNFTPAVFNTLVWVNVLAGLALLDTVLRRRRTGSGYKH
jgi:hypothetical protein